METGVNLNRKRLVERVNARAAIHGRPGTGMETATSRPLLAWLLAFATAVSVPVLTPAAMAQTPASKATEQGSLRAAIEHDGPRIVVFEVGA